MAAPPTPPAIAAFSVKGLCAAPFTAFKAGSRDLNLEVVDQQVKALGDSGVGAAFVGGTTGESLSMTLPERKALLEAWIPAGKAHGVTIIAHVGCESLRETIELAKHAEASGAAAVGVMPPVFFKPATVGVLVEMLATVAKACPSLPVYYYHIACMTGVDFWMEPLLDAVEAAGIPNFRGIKFTDYKLHDFMLCSRKYGGKYDMLFGRDEMWLSAHVVGAKGYVGSTYNYMPGPYLKAKAAIEAGKMEEAQDHLAKALGVIKLLGQSARYGHSGCDVGKACLELRGVPIGPPRPPKVEMSAEGKALLKEDLTKLGFFEF